MTDINLAELVTESYSAQSMNSARSQQARDRILGPSDLGGCRSYIAHMLSDAPRVERKAPPLAAFVGTWVGEGLERAYVDKRPQAQRQTRIRAVFPSGRATEGSADLLDPDVGIIDFKSRDGLVGISRETIPFKNLAQVNIYLLGAIQQGKLPEGSKWNLVYIDRSGSEPEPKVISGELDMDVIHEVDVRIDQAEYAAMWGEEAPKDEPYNICERFCEYFEHCRGDWQPEGIITHPENLAAIEKYQRGSALEKEGRALKASAKKELEGVEGSTGDVIVRWVHVGPSEYVTKREGYDRLDVRKVK